MTMSTRHGGRYRVIGGELVTVAPLDYGLDASSGALLSMCDERIVIRRETASGHPVYVHFPRAGFSVARA